MISERIMQLIARKMGKEATEKEIVELQQLLQQYPDHHFLIEVLQSIEGEKSHKEPTMGEEHLVRESWLMLQEELAGISMDQAESEKETKKAKKIFFTTVMRQAAIWAGLILLSVAAIYLYKWETNTEPVAARINQIRVPYGRPVKKLLPDSSVVWLNAGSHIKYDDNFIQKNRNVYLDGEAYFSVKHDANHPFVVHAGNITVRALGTKFNVQAYQNENKIEATLISGKILVKIEGKSDHSIILAPNEKLTVTNEKNVLSENDKSIQNELSFEVKEVVQIPSIASVPEVAWLQDKLAFQNESFDELAKRMERRYDIQIIFKDSTLGKERLSGIFENENIQKALDLLQMTTVFRYKKVGDTVFLSR
jgi:ferric-dicitrate binding protein FerR (iron transport regulator)